MLQQQLVLIGFLGRPSASWSVKPCRPVATPLQHCRQRSGTDAGATPEFGLDGPMIPFSALLLSRLLRSASALGLIALLIACLLEWGLITADPARLS